jgi:hypothetical protein
MGHFRYILGLTENRWKWEPMKRVMRWCVTAIGLALLCTEIVPSAAQDEGYSKLLKALSDTKLTLADGLQYVKPPAVPISAKFELENKPNAKLSLSVYVATRGFQMGAKANQLNELAGTATTPWKPEASALQWS